MILIALILGLSAGLSPGPLLTLVVTETLRYGLGAGIKTALAPLITDLPIILLSLFVLTRFASSPGILGILSLCGAIVVFSIGLQTVRKPTPEEVNKANPGLPIVKGSVVNLLNPHPYLFWFTVGGPLVVEASKSGKAVVVGFFVVFYTCLVGSKVLLALSVYKTRGLFMRRNLYSIVVRLLGCVLCILGIVLFIDGIRSLKGATNLF